MEQMPTLSYKLRKAGLDLTLLWVPILSMMLAARTLGVGSLESAGHGVESSHASFRQHSLGKWRNLSEPQFPHPRIVGIRDLTMPAVFHQLWVNDSTPA